MLVQWSGCTQSGKPLSNVATLDVVSEEAVDKYGFIKVANTVDIPAGGMKSVRYGSEDILIANVDWKYYAITGLCTHRQSALADGKLEGNIVTCPKHGSTFDVTTGKSTSGPKVLGFRGKTSDARAFEVKVE